MASKRGATKPGSGAIWSLGVRYRYTEPKGSDRNKLDLVATRKGVDPAQFWSAMSWAQVAAQKTLHGCVGWSSEVCKHIKNQTRLMGKVCFFCLLSAHSCLLSAQFCLLTSQFCLFTSVC